MTTTTNDAQAGTIQAVTVEELVGNVDVAKLTLEEKSKLTSQLVSKIITTKATLDAVKPLYDELDKATLALRTLIGVNRQEIEPATMIGVTIIDNFEEKNTTYKATGVKRFEAEIETQEERFKRAEKEAKAAAKLAKATKA